jgi:alcohol dehydrogenase class IV
MDALTQLIEPFVSIRANAMTDIYCREGMRLVAHALRRACEHGSDLNARTDMSMASLLGGLALANAGLGAVHGFAAPIGGMFDAPHGAVCAALLAPVTRVNLIALRQRDAAGPALSRYAEVARILTGHPLAGAGDLVPWLEDLAADLHIPSLASYGIGEADALAICDSAALASSMKANPIPLEAPELLTALRAAL